MARHGAVIRVPTENTMSARVLESPLRFAVATQLEGTTPADTGSLHLLHRSREPYCVLPPLDRREVRRSFSARETPRDLRCGYRLRTGDASRSYIFQKRRLIFMRRLPIPCASNQ